MSTDTIFKKYNQDHLKIIKTCEDECVGDGEDCEKCMLIKAHNELREELKTHLSIMEEVESSSTDDIYSFLTGSYKRGTMIRPPKDVDFFNVLLADDYTDYKPADILSILYASIADIYPEKEKNNEIRVQAHSVSVKFSDTFSIDVIPAFEDGDNYRIPHVPMEGEDDWLISNPKTHADFVKATNKANDGKFLALARLIKSINRHKIKGLGVKVKSIHLEMLAAIIFESGGITSYAEGLNIFFREAINRLEEGNVIDPANEENNIDDYLSDGERNLLKEIFTRLSILSAEAVKLEGEGRTADAIGKWKQIFNDPNFDDTVKQNIASIVASAITSGGLYITSSQNELSVTPIENEQRRVPRSSSWGE